MVVDAVTNEPFPLKPNKEINFSEFTRYEYTTSVDTHHIDLPFENRLYSLEKRFVYIYVNGVLIPSDNYEIYSKTRILLIDYIIPRWKISNCNKCYSVVRII
jgi:hypothetical protein